jgi:hypothetical protein
LIFDFIHQPLGRLAVFYLKPSLPNLVTLGLSSNYRQDCQPSLRSAVFFLNAKIVSLRLTSTVLNLLKPSACQPSVALRVLYFLACMPRLPNLVTLGLSSTVLNLLKSPTPTFGCCGVYFRSSAQSSKLVSRLRKNKPNTSCWVFVVSPRIELGSRV